MAHVLAEAQGWDRKSFPSPIPCQTFAALRDGVRSNQIDYFLWEYFTCKRYYESSQTSQIKKIGQIYSPWSSWKIAARNPCDERLDDMFEKLNQGIKYFLDHKDESIRYISTNLDYEEGDAREWLQGVKFAVDVRGVSQGVVQKTVEALQKADVVAEGSKDIRGMIGVDRG